MKDFYDFHDQLNEKLHQIYPHSIEYELDGFNMRQLVEQCMTDLNVKFKYLPDQSITDLSQFTISRPVCYLVYGETCVEPRQRIYELQFKYDLPEIELKYPVCIYCSVIKKDKKFIYDFITCCY